jgi:hypothetical protein
MLRWIAVLFTYLLSLPLPVNIQSDLPPYLYYYSDYLNAFVVERADGSDSRMIGQGLVPKGDNIFIGSGWSPSGNWFAWTSYFNGGAIGGTGESISYVIATDTGEPFKRVNGLANAFLAWSPNEDRLLVIDPTDRMMTDEATVPHFLARISLIDMTSQTVITEFDLDVNGVPKWAAGTSDIVWSSDGQFAAFYYRPYPYLEPYQETYKIVTVTKDGTIQEQPVHSTTTTAYIGAVPPLPQNLIVRYEPSRQIIAVSNPLTGETSEIDAPMSQDSFWQTFDWNATGDFALIDEYVAYPQHRLWLLSLPDNTLTLIDDMTFEANFYSAAHSGSSLTEAINVPAGWSPDGRWAVFRSSEDYFSLLDLQTNTVSEISDVPVNGNTIEVQWSIDNHTVTFGDANSRKAFQYDPDTKITTSTLLDQTLGWNITFYSPSERYLSQGAMGQPLVTIDRLTGKKIQFQVSGNATVTDQGIRWHPDEQWVIKGDANFMTDGSGFRLIGVSNLSRTLWRELGACYFTAHCANWLPPQVNINRLPSGSSQSVVPAPESVDYSVEFSFGETNENAVALVPDPLNPNFSLLQDDAGKTRYRLRYGACKGITTYIRISLSPDESLRATAPLNGGKILLWDAQSGELVAHLNTQGYDVSFSEDGAYLYTRSWRSLSMWNVDEVLQQAAEDYCRQ